LEEGLVSAFEVARHPGLGLNYWFAGQERIWRSQGLVRIYSTHASFKSRIRLLLVSDYCIGKGCYCLFPDS